MGDWIRVEFWAQLSDGMEVVDVDHGRTAETLARVFGFSRVTHLWVDQVNDGQAPTVRKLINDAPSYGQRVWPSR